MKSLATIIGLACVAVNATYGQVGSINSAVIVQDLFQPPVPSVFSGVNTFSQSPSTGQISLSEANVSPGGNGYANKDAWYFSANGGASAYQFQNNDYFDASFKLTLTGGIPGIDLEGGFLFSNPSGSFGGDLSTFVVGQGGNAGTIFQGGGPSYFPFSPGAGGYGTAGFPTSPPGGVPNYAMGETYTLGLNYVIDPNTGNNAFEYSVNGVFALCNYTGDSPYFDLGAGAGPFGSPGSTLGGYFQIQESPNGNSGSAVFTDISISAVPEQTSSFALLSASMISLSVLPRLLRRRV